MKYKKISAFISSNYESLKAERDVIIKSLLDAGMIPICMEYFTATSSRNFDDLKVRIDQSDLFIMLLGPNYGSVDENGISWTQREYEYACSQNKTTYLILSKKYMQMKQSAKQGAAITESEQKQIKFAEGIEFTQTEEDNRPLNRIMGQIIANIDVSKCKGWLRDDGINDDKQTEQKIFKPSDILGKWYHVHLKERNKDYIRLGTVEISQKENTGNVIYRLNAKNYDVLRYEPEQDKIVLDRLNRTTWSGDYYFKDKDTLVGIYEASRETRGKYDSWEVDKGIYKGIHELNIVEKNYEFVSDESKYMFEGTFHDVYPSPKAGLVYMFRTENERYNFLKEYFDDVLRRKNSADIS